MLYLLVYASMIKRKCSICPRHHVYSSDSSSRRCKCRKQRGCINISRNSSVESKSSDQQPVLRTLQRNECEDRAHGACYNWFDLARFHYWCRSTLFFATLWQETLYRSYLLWNVSPAISTKRRKLWQSGWRSREGFSTCKMQIVRWFLCDREVAETATIATIKRQNHYRTFTSFLENTICFLESRISSSPIPFQTYLNFNKIFRNNFFLYHHTSQ